MPYRTPDQIIQQADARRVWGPLARPVRAASYAIALPAGFFALGTCLLGLLWEHARGVSR